MIVHFLIEYMGIGCWVYNGRVVGARADVLESAEGEYGATGREGE